MRDYDFNMTIEENSNLAIIQDFFENSSNHHRNHKLALWLINSKPNISVIEFLARLTVLINTNGDLEKYD